MPIEKTTPTTLKHRGDTYVVLPSSTITAIQNPEALAILAFLLDRPANWIIRRGHIMERFSLGRDRYERAMRELHALGLAWKEQTRDDQGHITNTSLCVSAIPADHSPYSRKTDNTAASTVSTENPQCGKTDHLHITDLKSLNITDGPAEKKAGPRRMAEDWYPSDKLLERAVKLGYQFDDFDGLVAEFRDYWIAQKTRRKDWDLSFMNRLKTIHAQQQTRGNTHGKQKSASQLLADDLNKTLQAGARPH